MDREQERRQWEQDQESEIAAEIKKQERIAIIEDLKEQTKQGRERHQDLKKKRKIALEIRKNKLKEKGALRSNAAAALNFLQSDENTDTQKSKK